MKKRLSILLALLVATALLLALPALASDGAPYIRDEALPLTYDEETALEKQAQSIADSTSCAVYVLTVDSIGSQTIRDFAKAYYTDHALGYGDGRNGILFCISMEGRDYVTVTYGKDPDDDSTYGIGITAFSDARVEALEDAVVPSLSDGDYAGAFTTYLDTCANYLETADAGSEDYTNYDNNYNYDDGADYSSGFYFPLSHLAIIFLIAFVIALIVCLIWRAQMKTARAATQADHYVPQGGFQLTHERDTFLYRTESRRRIERDNDHSGVDHDGFGGSSGGKF